MSENTMSTMTMPARMKAVGSKMSPRSWSAARSSKRAAKTRVSMSVVKLTYRGIAIVVDWVLLTLITFGVVPMLGMWLHQNSGVATGQLSTDGAIVMWLAPFVFLLLLGVAGTYHLLRAVWALSTRGIEHSKNLRLAHERRGELADAAKAKTTTSTSARTTPVAAARSGKRKTNARSK